MADTLRAAINGPAPMKEHPEIWLQPWCEECEEEMDAVTEGQAAQFSIRGWCWDKPDNCEKCGKPPSRYVLVEEKEDGGG